MDEKVIDSDDTLFKVEINDKYKAVIAFKTLEESLFNMDSDKTYTILEKSPVSLFNWDSNLEISTLNKDNRNWAIKIQVPLYLPQKLSKKTGKINGNNYRQKVLDYLETGEAYQVELIKKEGKIHVHMETMEHYK